jgi:XTP/dITP diphosphohydrolase
MPSHKTHCAISKKRTGYDFSELHDWIDGPSKTLGKNHRTVRHAWNETDMKTIYFITSNKGKLREAIEKLRPIGYSVEQKDVGYPEIQADTLEEVAVQGVQHVRERCNKAFILEDAGLFIDAVKGFPGVYSKYVFFTLGLPGILQLLDGEKNRTAVFRSVYAYSEPGKQPVIVAGECQGTITREPRGGNGFGYDPIFQPTGVKKTFAEMAIQEKNQYSHRAAALEKLAIVLGNL